MPEGVKESEVAVSDNSPQGHQQCDYKDVDDEVHDSIDPLDDYYQINNYEKRNDVGIDQEQYTPPAVAKNSGDKDQTLSVKPFVPSALLDHQGMETLRALCFSEGLWVI